MVCNPNNLSRYAGRLFDKTDLGMLNSEEKQQKDMFEKEKSLHFN